MENKRSVSPPPSLLTTENLQKNNAQIKQNSRIIPGLSHIPSQASRTAQDVFGAPKQKAEDEDFDIPEDEGKPMTEEVTRQLQQLKMSQPAKCAGAKKTSDPRNFIDENGNSLRRCFDLRAPDSPERCKQWKAEILFYGNRYICKACYAAAAKERNACNKQIRDEEKLNAPEIKKITPKVEIKECQQTVNGLSNFFLKTISGLEQGISERDKKLHTLEEEIAQLKRENSELRDRIRVYEQVGEDDESNA